MTGQLLPLPGYESQHLGNSLGDAGPVQGTTPSPESTLRVTARQASESDLGTGRHLAGVGAGQRVGCEEGRVRLRPLGAAQGLTRCSCSSCRVCGSPRRPGAPRHILHSDPDGQCRWVSVGAEETPVSPVDLIWALTPSARACRDPTPGRVGTARHSRDSCPFHDAPG